MKPLLLLICSGFFLGVKAQQRNIIKTRLVDSANAEPVSLASISVLSANDSSFITYTITGKQGEFDIKKPAPGNYFLYISASGFINYRYPFTVSIAKEQFLPPILTINRDYKNLSEAIVRSQSPVSIKADSISFKLDFFKTSPGASLEDALKKLPGIQVAKDGTIKAMGETVQKIYVDGKEFFGNDPQAATKNISADMIEQVQVFDDMSEQARFTKIDDGNRYKAMNIRLKKDRNKGDFGKITAGEGTDNRHDYGLSWNHFNDTRKVSVIGGASNTNKSSYSAGLNNSTTQFSNSNSNNSSAPKSAGSTGISSNTFAGFNYNDQWSRGLDFRSSYLYSSNNNQQQYSRYKNYAYPDDSSAEMNNDNNLRNKTATHRFNPRIEYAIDSFHSILYTANFSIQDGLGSEKDSLFGIAWGQRPYLSLLGSSYKNEKKSSIAYSGELLYRMRFRMPGRTFTFGWKNSITSANGDHNLNSLISNYDVNRNLLQVINPDQHCIQESASRYNGFSASFTNPAGKNKLVEINYAYSTSYNSSDKKTFDYNSASGRYDKANLFQTNNFDNNSQSGRGGINFRAAYKRFSYQVGSSLQITSSRNRSIQPQAGKDTVTRQRFTNFFPAASFNYTFSRNTNLRIGYRGRTSMPSVVQLQDVTDFSDPLFIRAGNPLLKQEFSNMLSLNLNYYDPRSSMFLNAVVTILGTYNKIVNSIDSSGPAVMLIKPVNLGGSNNLSGNISLGCPLKKIKGTNLLYNLSAFLSKDPALVFGHKYYTRMLVIDQSLGVNYIAENVSAGFNAGMVYNQAVYDIQRSVNANFKFTWSTDLRFQFKKDFFILTDLENYNHSGRTPGFNPSILLWNLALARKLFKDRSGEIKFTAYDLLKQDKGITRFTSENYFEDTRYQLTPRFFLLSFTCNFRRMEKKQPAAADQPMMFFK
jgi:hypothetical protein